MQRPRLPDIVIGALIGVGWVTVDIPRNNWISVLVWALALLIAFRHSLWSLLKRQQLGDLSILPRKNQETDKGALTVQPQPKGLSDLTNIELQQRVTGLARRLRLWGQQQSDFDAVFYKQAFDQRLRQLERKASKEELQRSWDEETQRSTQRSNEQSLAFKNLFVADCIALRNEMIGRLISPNDPRAYPRLLLEGAPIPGTPMLANDMANYLESLSRQLPQ
jgi:hypothetical protein